MIKSTRQWIHDYDGHYCALLPVFEIPAIGPFCTCHARNGGHHYKGWVVLTQHDGLEAREGAGRWHPAEAGGPKRKEVVCDMYV